jgi:hypothetical protein
MTDETAQPVMIPYAKHLEIVAEHLRAAAGVVEARAQAFADAIERINHLERALRAIAKGGYTGASFLARAALAGQDKGKP